MSTPSASQIETSRASFRGYCSRSFGSPNWRGFTKIVTTVVASDARARCIRARWPSCNQPLVGTSPIGRGATPSARRSSSRVRTTRVNGARIWRGVGERPARGRLEVGVEGDAGQRIAGSAIVRRPPQGLVEDAVVHPDRLLRPRERPGSHFLGVLGGRLRDRSAQVRERSRMAWNELAEAEEVVHDLDLTAATRTGTDADRRDPEPRGDQRRELLRHELEHDREGTRLLDRDRIGQQAPSRLARLALGLDLAAHAVLRLGRPADMALDGDAGLDEGFDDPGAPDATLDLHGLYAAVAEEAAGVLDRLVNRGVRQERHVTDDERPARPGGAPPGGGV